MADGGGTYGTLVASIAGAGLGALAAALAQGRRRSAGGLVAGAAIGGLTTAWGSYALDAYQRGPVAGLSSTDPFSDVLLASHNPFKPYGQDGI